MRLERDFAPAPRLINNREAVSLAEGLGRVLAEPIVARRAVPPSDNSALDGWAFRYKETSTSHNLFKVVGRAAAGHPYTKTLEAGQAVRIFTGAPMPQGADTVAAEEVCATPDEGTVSIPSDIKAGSNARKAGEDLTAKQQALPAGQRLRPQDLGLAASCGVSQLIVRPRLSVALFSSGDELLDPPSTPQAWQLWDGNRAMAQGLLTALGCVVADGGILPDDQRTTESALKEASARHDLVLASGGMSQGAEDHLRRAAERLGSLSFWRLAIKPGRPIALGYLDKEKTTPFAGLPGNPVAAFVTFALLVRPLILRLQGAHPAPRLGLPVVAGFSMAKKRGRREWVRVRLVADSAGQIRAEKFPRAGAGVLSSLTESDGLLELTEELDQVEAGKAYPFLSFSSLIY